MTQDLKLADQIALLLLKSYLKDAKNAEMSQLSQAVLREAIDFAYKQAIRTRKDNPFIDFSTAIYYELNGYLEVMARKYGPLIFFVPENVGFKKMKDMEKVNILIIQPKSFGKDVFESKDTSIGTLLIVKKDKTEKVRKILKNCLDIIKKEKPDFVCFPELCFVNDGELKKAYSKVALDYDCFIIGGSFHDEVEESNVCPIFCPNGKIVIQRKIFRSKEFGEGIKIRREETIKIINYGQGKFSSLICIDSESEKIRDVLKERLERCKCPELIFNPSCTSAIPRAHSQLRNLMSLIFASIVFCNDGSFGCSCVIFPEISLNKRGFKKIQIKKCTTETMYEKIELDISVLQSYKRANINCLIAPKK